MRQGLPVQILEYTIHKATIIKMYRSKEKISDNETNSRICKNLKYYAGTIRRKREKRKIILVKLTA